MDVIIPLMIVICRIYTILQHYLWLQMSLMYVELLIFNFLFKVQRSWLICLLKSERHWGWLKCVEPN